MSEVLITAAAVGQARGDREIFHDVDLTVHAGDRTAVVGPNGGGKSTLLRLLAGIEPPASGRVARASGASIGYLPQIAAAVAPGRSVAEELARRTGVAAARDAMDRETRRLTEGELDRIEAQAEAVELWSRLGGADLEARVGRVLEEVGLPPGWVDRPLGSLSGGQLARVNLASLRLSRLDVALLDEPGNHLDAKGLEMLRDSIPRAARAVVLVSHDRSLLESFASEVVELERGGARHHRGGWVAYVRERERARDVAQAEWERAVAERRRLVEMERRLRSQAEVGERRARRSGEPDKFIRHLAIQSAQKNTAIGGIAKRIESTEIPEKPWREGLSTLLLDAAQPIHAPRVVVAEGAVAAAGAWRSAPTDLDLSPGERLLLAGPNGSGKSSLIAMIAGRRRPVEGTLRVPARARIVELAQQETIFGRARGTLVERFRSLSGLDETAARTALAAMRIGAGQAERPPDSLSPGEATRAELALLAQTRAACLLLDEPTNHLDVEALEVLEQALAGWPGALIVASHDKAFREAIRFDRTLTLG